MRPPNYYVWEWLDDEGNIVYIGNSPRSDGGELPWTVLWTSRFIIDSDLNRWLRSLEKQPARGTFLPAQPMTKREAYTLAGKRRHQLRLSNNPALLSARRDGTTDGGGTRRAVVSPLGDLYVSVREAARDQGLPNSSQITRLCQDPNSAWRYLDEAK